MDVKWNFLLSEFSRLGGIAENVCQKEGEFGRGIFSINPKLRSRIYTPSNLLVRKSDIYLENNQLRIKKDSKYTKEIRNFFNYYQDNFSWGFGGKEITESFEKELNCLPYNLKKLLKKCNLVDLEERHKGKFTEVVKKQFLNARAVRFGNCSVIAPIWDLVNHEVNAYPYEKSFLGLSTPKYKPKASELTFFYGYMSPIQRIFNYGFFCKETIVFSMPFSLIINDSGIKLICKGLDLKDDKIIYETNQSEVIINGLPIAAIKRPSFIKTYFYKLLDSINVEDVYEDLLSNIISLNYTKRKEILDQFKIINNYSSCNIIKAITYEMESIS